MEKVKHTIEWNRKKVLGLIGLILFSLIFILSCFAKVLPIGNILVGTFGAMVYPISFILGLFCLAKFLGFSYSRSLKSTTYFLIALFSLIFAIHSIATFKELDAVVTWNQLKQYLNLSYEKITALGSFGSILAGLVSMILGGMGTIVLFVILTTIFAGLFVDFQFYGKFEEKHIKSLKTRKLRNEVFNSDKTTSQNGVPSYSFNNENEENEITVDADEYEQNNSSTFSYSDSDVVDEISNDEIDSSDYSQTTNYFSNNETNLNENNNQSAFDSNIYSDNDNYPNVYDSNVDDYRRQFMNDTFGNFSIENNESEDSSIDNQVKDTIINDESYQNYNFENNKNLENQDLSDEISNILNTNEDDEDSSNNVIDTPISNFGFNENSNYQNNRFENTSSSLFEDNEDKSEEKININSFENNNEFEKRNQGFHNPGFASRINEQRQPSQNYSMRQNFENREVRNKQTPNVVVPSKETKPLKGINIGMTGLRYNPPPLSLLKTPVADNGDYSVEQNRKAKKLEDVLDAFGIAATVKNIVRGPKITRYELSVPLGVSLKKIPQHEDDIAAALSAKTILIKAPIPGTPYVGIELENDTFSNVYERELLESDAFQNCRDPLPIAIGKDISGEIVVKSLVKMVHLLIAGSTGSGKSVFMHNIVLSLIYKTSPDDLRLIMIDPKRGTEFNRYNGMPHLLTPEIASNKEKAINALKWSVKEMDRRYDLLGKSGYNTIESYNKSELVKSGQMEKFPYIVIIVDELAELMMADKKVVENCIQRLTQLARACGIHLILATQRPSVDIISGVIKNNIPSRIALSLQSGIDSKTILSTVGAEKLLGHGDMIFAPTGTSVTPRLQGAYASDDEIKSVIEYDKKYNQANYDDEVSNTIYEDEPTLDEVANAEIGCAVKQVKLDSYFKAALKEVMIHNSASISFLQRRLSIGYSRAAKIIDQMEEKGFVAPASGSKTRKILITPEQFFDEFGEQYDEID